MNTDELRDLWSGESAATLPEPCARCRDHLDEWVDAQPSVRSGTGPVGLGSAESLEFVERHLEECADCSEEARWATEVQVALSNLPVVACPEALAERIRAIPLEVASGNPPRSSDLPRQLVEFLAAAALVALSLAAVWWWRAPTNSSRDQPTWQADRARPSSGDEASEAVLLPSMPPTVGEAAADPESAGAIAGELLAQGFSQADLDRAEKEARVAFALLGAVSQRAGFALRDDVLREQVALMPRRALSRLVSD